MKARLMFADRDFEVAARDAPDEQDLIQDLELTTLWKAMAEETRSSARRRVPRSLGPRSRRRRSAIDSPSTSTASRTEPSSRSSTSSRCGDRREEAELAGHRNESNSPGHY